MDLDPKSPASSPGVMPPLPEPGLAHVLSAWSGQGQLLEALAAVQVDDPVERLWTARDVRRRANRVLFADLLPFVERLPLGLRRWQDALPAESSVDRALMSAPRGRFDVVRTRLRGWPPDGFVTRFRERIPEELLSRTTAWTLRDLLKVAQDATSVEPQLTNPVHRQLAAAAEALKQRPLSEARSEVPDRSTIAAVRRAGPPWATVALIADRVRRATALDELARRLIEPDERLRWRLFHLGVLGEVILGLVEEAWSLFALRPLSAGSVGSNYSAVRENRAPVEIWFEAAGIWSTRGVRSPYVDATQGLLDGGTRALGPDLLLASEGRALIIECKYSASGSYVARGYDQAVTYAAEMTGAMFNDVEAAVVGPDGVVVWSSQSSTAAGPVSSVPASAVRELVRTWVR